MPAPTVVAGVPCWIDLFTSDPEGASAFYGGLFGWTAEPADPRFGGYFVHSLDGRVVSGCMRNDGTGGPDTWSVYLATDDAERTAADAAAHGGNVVVPPMVVEENGSMTFMVDPTGAAIGAWQADQVHGFQVVAEPGAAAWFELHTRDHDRAVAFYRDVFRWRDVHAMSATPEFTYTTLGRDDDARAGIMDARSDLAEGEPSHWRVYFQVASTDDAVARAEALGGSVTVPPIDTPPPAAVHSLGMADELHDPERLRADAAAAFDAALEHDPGRIAAWCGRSALLLHAGRHADALEAADRAIAIDGAAVGAWVARGRAERELHRLTAALASADRAIALDESSPEAHALRGEVLDLLDRPEAAGEASEQANDLLIMHLRLGTATSVGGPLGDLLEGFADLARDAPHDPEVLTERGWALLRVAESAERLGEATRETRERPDDAWAWSMLADALFDLGRYDEAVEATRRSIDLEPDQDLWWSWLGTVLDVAGRHEEALEAYARACELEPEEHNYWAFCGEMLEELGRHEEAAEMFTRAFDLARAEHEADDEELEDDGDGDDADDDGDHPAGGNGFIA